MSDDPAAELVAARARHASLRAAQASGVTRIANGDRSVQYASADDLAKAVEVVAGDIARLETALGLRAPVRRTRAVTFVTGRGL